MTNRTMTDPTPYPEQLIAVAKLIDQALRDSICDQWWYSAHGTYSTYDDLPSDIRTGLIEAAHQVLQMAQKEHDAQTQPTHDQFNPTPPARDAYT